MLILQVKDLSLTFRVPAGVPCHFSLSRSCGKPGCLQVAASRLWPVQSDTVKTSPALLGQNVGFCFCTLFSLIKHTFSILNYGCGQSGYSCADAVEKREPRRYTLCFMAELLPKHSWTQCPTNYFSLKLIFPVSSVYQLQSHILFSPQGFPVHES